MNTNHFNNIPWNSKSKFIVLKKFIDTNDTENLFEQINREDVAWGLINALKINHLVPHSANVYHHLRKKDDHFHRIINTQLKDVLCMKDINKMQINYFKYFFCKENVNLLEDILKIFTLKTKEEIPEFILIKIIHNTILIYGNTEKIENALSLATTESLINVSLKHENIQVRLAALELICDKDINQQNVNEVELFIIENVYVENGSFRNQLLKIYTNYILKLQEILYKHAKKIKYLENKIRLTVENHFQWTVDFIVNCLKIKSYQRNKFALLLFEFILNHFETQNESELRKRGALKKNFCSKKMQIVKQYLKSEEKWKFNCTELEKLLIEKVKDESADISEKSSDLLITYFKTSTQIDYYELYTSCTEYLLNVSEFYNIEASVQLFDVAIRCHEPLLQNVDDILNKYIYFAEIYLNDLESDFGQTIMNSNELYTYLLIFKKFKNELTICQIEAILNLILKGTTLLLNAFYVDEKAYITAPSFAEMSTALNNILNKEETDDTMLTDMEQVLINRIWLNVKVCCELFFIIGSHTQNVGYQTICLDMLTTILQSNRHKGIIEAAGIALENLVNYLTEHPEYEAVIDSKMNSILENIVNNSSRSSYTRRTAGLSILIYHISLGDQRKSKFLLKNNLQKLISFLQNYNNNLNEENENCFDLKDSALVVALHCLKPLVHDVRLWNETQNYLMELMEVCFSNMTEESNWNARNAAVQLYGALICKLIGQNKDTSLEDIHETYPFLLNYILKLFKQSEQQYLFQILEFFSQTFTISYRAQSNNEFDQIINKLKSIVLQIVENNNYYLRNLAAKTYTNLTLLNDSGDELKRIIEKTLNLTNNCVKVNKLHGYILIISHLVNFIKCNGQNIISSDIFDDVALNIKLLLKRISCLPAFVTYPLIKSFSNCIYCTNSISNNIGKKEISALQYENIKSISEKIDIFLSEKYIKNIDIQFYEFDEIINTFKDLYEKKELLLPTETWNKIIYKLFNVYFNCDDANIKLVVLKFIITILTYNESITIPAFEVNVVNDNIFICKKLVHSLALLSCFYKFVPKNFDSAYLSLLINKLKRNSHPLMDEDLRFDVAQSLVILLRYYTKCKINIYDIMYINYWLLLDEESIIRETASLFVTRLRNILTTSNFIGVKHAYCSIFSLVSDCLPKIFSKKDEAIFLMDCLLTFYIVPNRQTKLNPFTQRNIGHKLEDAYLLKKLYENLCILLKQVPTEDYEFLKKYFFYQYLTVQSSLSEKQIVNKLKMEYIIKVKYLFI